MTTTRREELGTKAFALPVVGILLLIGVYWLASEWQSLPRLFSAAIAAIS